MKTISIVIVTYNSSRYIGYCLDSILTQDFEDYEIIIVDNASIDKTCEIIKKGYPDIILMENKKNLGVCAARNQAIDKATGMFILCLDPDVSLGTNFLQKIYEAVKDNTDIGASGSLILREDKKTIYSAGIYPSFLWRFFDIGSGRIGEDRFKEKKYVFGVSAAAALYRREALESVKQGMEYFDEDFFYFFEDVDISWRLRKKGWKILFDPEAVCFHAGGRSRKKDRISQYLCMRNRYFLIMKNASWFDLPRFIIVFFIYDLWRNLFMLITNSDNFFKALTETFESMPKMLKKRRGTQE